MCADGSVVNLRRCRHELEKGLNTALLPIGDDKPYAASGGQPALQFSCMAVQYHLIELGLFDLHHNLTRLARHGLPRYNARAEHGMFEQAALARIKRLS